MPYGKKPFGAFFVPVRAAGDGVGALRNAMPMFFRELHFPKNDDMARAAK